MIRSLAANQLGLGSPTLVTSDTDEGLSTEQIEEKKRKKREMWGTLNMNNYSNYGSQAAIDLGLGVGMPMLGGGW